MKIPRGITDQKKNIFGAFALLLVGCFFFLEILHPRWLVVPTSPQGSETADTSSKILLWHQEEPENSKILNEWISDFQSLNPGVVVESMYYPVEEMRERFVTAASAGQAADLVWGVNDMAGVFDSAGLIQPVGAFIDTQRFAKETLDPVVMADRIMGVPMSYGNNLILFYNKRFVSTPPKTMEDLIDASLKFQKRSSENNLFGLVFFQAEPFWLAPFLFAFDAWPVTQANGSLVLDVKSKKFQIIQALSYFKDLKAKHKIIPQECDYHCAVGLFTENKALFTINGDWATVELKKALGDHLGFAPLPTLELTGRPLVPLIGGRYVFINAKLDPHKSKNIKLFLNHLSGLAVQKDVALKLNRVPSTHGALQEEAVMAYPTIQGFRAAAHFAEAMPPYPEMRALWDGLRPAQQKLMSGHLTPQGAYRLMEKTVPEALTFIKGR